MKKVSRAACGVWLICLTSGMVDPLGGFCQIGSVTTGRLSVRNLFIIQTNCIWFYPIPQLRAKKGIKKNCCWAWSDLYLFLDPCRHSDVCFFGSLVIHVNFKCRYLRIFFFPSAGEGYSKGTFSLLTDFDEKCQGTDVSFDNLHTHIPTECVFWNFNCIYMREGHSPC